MAAETCRVAGCLPPLRPRCNGHRPACTVPGDMYAQNDELVSMYAFIVQLMAPYCDFLLCHSMSCSREARAAALAAQAAGKDVWISWSVAAEPASCLLLGGQPLSEAVATVSDCHAVRAMLVQCSVSSSTTLALQVLRQAVLPDVAIGAHLGHTRGADASEGVAGGSGGTLPPGEYAKHAQAWIDGGASIVGGGSGFLPEHIAALSKQLLRRPRLPHPGSTSGPRPSLDRLPPLSASLDACRRGRMPLTSAEARWLLPRLLLLAIAAYVICTSD